MPDHATAPDAYPRTDLPVLSPEALALAARIRARKITYLSEKKLASLAQVSRGVQARGVPGVLIEAGCALGGSSILLAALKDPDRALQVYDVFGMIPPPGEHDTPDVHARYAVIREGKSKGIMGERYYGYVEDLYDVVLGHFAEFGIDPAAQSVSLVKGLVQDTLVGDGPVAFAHIDVDWYDPVMCCLERLFPRLSVGGTIILDDYHAWGGCKKATDEFLQRVAGQCRWDHSEGPMHIEKTVA